MLLKNFVISLNRLSNLSIIVSRNVTRIPHWEHHIRFDPKIGRKRPNQDVLDRFKRLNNGMWIHAQAGRNIRRYAKDDVFNETSLEYMTCTKEECNMLDKLVTPFWLRRRHYVDDPYEPYHTRHGINSPRVNDAKQFFRERKKILLEDTIADKYINDR